MDITNLIPGLDNMKLTDKIELAQFLLINIQNDFGDKRDVCENNPDVFHPSVRRSMQHMKENINLITANSFNFHDFNSVKKLDFELFRIAKQFEILSENLNK